MEFTKMMDYNNVYDIYKLTIPACESDDHTRKQYFEVDDIIEQHAFPTYKQAKKFAKRLISDYKGTKDKLEAVSGDPVVHHRACYAVDMLMEDFNHFYAKVTCNDLPGFFEGFYFHRIDIINGAVVLSDIVTPFNMFNRMAQWDPANTHSFGKLRAVYAVMPGCFKFETYKGIVYTITGIN